jgi:hypothetical protein
MSDQLPLWVVAASLALNGIFLSRLLRKLDKLYDYVVGQPGRRGLGDRVVELEKELGIVDETAYRGPERRRWTRQRKGTDA